MNTLNRIGLFLVALHICHAGIATEPLSFKWENGESVKYLMTQDMIMNINAGPGGIMQSTTSQKMWMDWSVKSVENNGEALIAQGFDRITMSTKAPMGPGIEYDSDNDEAAVGMATLVAPMFDSLVKDPIDVVMLSTGEIGEIELSDEVAETIKQMPGGVGSTDMITQMIKQGSITFPSKPLEVGETWTQEAELMTPQVGKMKVTATYTYNGPKEVEGKTLESITPSITMEMPEDANSTFKMDFKSKGSEGEILFDNEEGMVHSSNIKQIFDITITMQGQTITNEMIQTIELRQLTEEEISKMKKEPAAAVAE